MSIDLEGIITSRKLDKNDLAKQLFPNHGYPGHALTSVLKGKLLLNSAQISKLATFTGMSVDQIFSEAGWSTKYTVNANETELTINRGSFKAVLDLHSYTTRVYDSESMFHEIVLTNGSMTLTEFIVKINSIINKHQKKNG